jgi:hypothetical protein
MAAPRAAAWAVWVAWTSKSCFPTLRVMENLAQAGFSFVVCKALRRSSQCCESALDGCVVHNTLQSATAGCALTQGEIMFQLLSRYFWAVALAMALVKYLKARNRVQAATDLSPQEKQSGEICLKWFAVLSSLPWLIMGWGILFGDVSSVFSFLRPGNGNFYVMLWICTVLALTMVYAGWVLFADGARQVRLLQLQNFHAGGRGVPLSETAIKILAALGPFFVLFWIWCLTRMNVSLPPSS